MSGRWYMLTVVGRDRPGIVAELTSALYAAGAELGEASMLRLGGNFTIMLMVHFEGDGHVLEAAVRPVAMALDLQLHLDEIDGRLHELAEPDAIITISGADRAGIVAHVTRLLAEAGLNILHLDSTIAGSEASPIYVMRIEGQARQGLEALRRVLETIEAESFDVSLQPVETLIA